MPYIDSTDIENFLGLDLQTNGQTQVDALIPAIEAYFERQCNRKWSYSGNQVETFDGNTDTFFVKAPPIASVVSITDDGLAISTDDIYAYDSYIKLGYRTTNKRRCVVITYTTDATLPADVKHAMVRWVAQIYKEAKDAGKPVSRVSMGPMSVEFTAKEVPQFVKDVIAAHRLRPV